MNLLPENISSYGAQIDSLTKTITYFAVIWFLAAFGTLLAFLILYRRKNGKKAEYITGNSWKEARILAFFVFLVVLSDLYIDVLNTGVWNHIKTFIPVSEEVVRINAFQWSWSYTYPGPDGKLNTEDDKDAFELHVPIGKKVVFDLTARDVVHSFWVKELRLKQDAVPGRTIKGWFEATKTGKYEILCAEICGINHSMMKGSLVVDSLEDYRKFTNELYGIVDQKPASLTGTQMETKLKNKEGK